MIQALKQKFSVQRELVPESKISFSSKRKWGAVRFAGTGSVFFRCAGTHFHEWNGNSRASAASELCGLTGRNSRSWRQNIVWSASMGAVPEKA